MVSDSLGLVDFAIEQYEFCSSLARWASEFFGRIQIINPACQFFFWSVHARYSLPKWQAVKLTFFAP